MFDYSVNESATKIIEEKIIPNAEILRIGVSKDNSGATIIDMGINYPGSWLAGKYFTEVGLGGLGEVNFCSIYIDKYKCLAVQVIVSKSLEAEMASHVSTWRLKNPETREITIISGPIRAVKGADVYARAVDYRDPHPKKAVACIQTTKYPPTSFIKLIAREVELNPKDIYFLVAPTACIVGSIQISARTVEQVLSTLYDHNFNLKNIIHAYGVAPIAPIAKTELDAYGLVNDCLVYGNETTLYVNCDDKEIISIFDEIPFSKKKNNDIYGL
ncbi:MAG: hypothetical protein IMZ60_05000, partial [Actinobacteria bacterium]|nr:hypothetical protein [Actinomycetota bacterium]